MATVQLRGTGRPSTHGKRELAKSMYLRGKSFLGAALLLRNAGGYEYVVLHLLCQGVEVVVKALLLFHDYDTYKPQLKKFGHDLAKLVDEALRLFKLRPLEANLEGQLNKLNDLYTQHLLRYASSVDILIDASTIPSDLVLKKSVAVIRLCERHIK